MERRSSITSCRTLILTTSLRWFSRLAILDTQLGCSFGNKEALVCLLHPCGPAPFSSRDVHRSLPILLDASLAFLPEWKAGVTRRLHNAHVPKYSCITTYGHCGLLIKHQHRCMLGVVFYWLGTLINHLQLFLLFSTFFCPLTSLFILIKPGRVLRRDILKNFKKITLASYFSCEFIKFMCSK